MRIVRSRRLTSGKLHVTVEVDPDENVHHVVPGMHVITPNGFTLLAIRTESYYELGHPHSEVVDGRILAESFEVSWDSLGQRWVPV